MEKISDLRDQLQDRVAFERALLARLDWVTSLDRHLQGGLSCALGDLGEGCQEFLEHLEQFLVEETRTPDQAAEQLSEIRMALEHIAYHVDQVRPLLLDVIRQIDDAASG